MNNLAGRDPPMAEDVTSFGRICEHAGPGLNMSGLDPKMWAQAGRRAQLGSAMGALDFSYVPNMQHQQQQSGADMALQNAMLNRPLAPRSMGNSANTHRVSMLLQEQWQEAVDTTQSAPHGWLGEPGDGFPSHLAAEQLLWPDVSLRGKGATSSMLLQRPDLAATRQSFSGTHSHTETAISTPAAGVTPDICSPLMQTTRWATGPNRALASLHETLLAQQAQQLSLRGEAATGSYSSAAAAGASAAATTPSGRRPHLRVSHSSALDAPRVGNQQLLLHALPVPGSNPPSAPSPRPIDLLRLPSERSDLLPTESGISSLASEALESSFFTTHPSSELGGSSASDFFAGAAAGSEPFRLLDMMEPEELHQLLGASELSGGSSGSLPQQLAQQRQQLLMQAAAKAQQQQQGLASPASCGTNDSSGLGVGSSSCLREGNSVQLLSAAMRQPLTQHQLLQRMSQERQQAQLQLLAARAAAIRIGQQQQQQGQVGVPAATAARRSPPNRVFSFKRQATCEAEPPEGHTRRGITARRNSLSLSALLPARQQPQQGGSGGGNGGVLGGRADADAGGGSPALSCDPSNVQAFHSASSDFLMTRSALGMSTNSSNANNSSAHNHNAGAGAGQQHHSAAGHPQHPPGQQQQHYQQQQQQQHQFAQRHGLLNHQSSLGARLGPCSAGSLGARSDSGLHPHLQQQQQHAVPRRASLLSNNGSGSPALGGGGAGGAQHCSVIKQEPRSLLELERSVGRSEGGPRVSMTSSSLGGFGGLALGPSSASNRLFAATAAGAAAAGPNAEGPNSDGTMDVVWSAAAAGGGAHGGDGGDGGKGGSRTRFMALVELLQTIPVGTGFDGYGHSSSLSNNMLPSLTQPATAAGPGSSHLDDGHSHHSLHGFGAPLNGAGSAGQLRWSTPGHGMWCGAAAAEDGEDVTAERERDLEPGAMDDVMVVADCSQPLPAISAGLGLPQHLKECVAAAGDPGSGPNSSSSLKGGGQAAPATSGGAAAVAGQSQGQGHAASSAVQLDFAALRPLFVKEVEAAARQLNISTTTLKLNCRALGVKRWPQRKLASLERLGAYVAECEDVAEEHRQVVLAHIKANHDAILENPNTPVMALLSKLREAQFKRNHALRTKTNA